MPTIIASTRPESAPLLSSTLRRILAATCLLAFPAALTAQTAHFSGAVSTIGSGFTNPAGVAVGSNGNVFVADYSNSTVYEIVAVNGTVSSSSTVNTVGSGFTNPSGVAVDSAGNVFVADTNNNAVKEIVAVSGSVSSSSTVNTVGNGFRYPAGVAVDSAGNVFVADTFHNAVKEIVAVSGSVSSSSTVNTVGSAFSGPNAVAVDSAGDVFVADSNNNAVKEIVAASGVVTSSSTVNTIGSGFNDPYGVTVDGAGNVFVADYYNNAVKEIVAVNGVVSSSSMVNTLGSGFNGPYGVAVDRAGDVFTGDGGNNAVKEIMTRGANFASVNVRATSSVLSLTFTFATAGAGITAAVLTQGTAGLDFADTGNGSCDTNGAAHAYAIGDTCTVDVTFKPAAPGARYGAVTLSSSVATIANTYLRGTGMGPQASFPPGTPGAVVSGFLEPGGVALDGAGDIFVADTLNNVVKEIVAVNGAISSSSTVTTVASGFNHPYSVAVDGAGNVFVADATNHAVKEIVAVHGTVSSSSTVTAVGSGFSLPNGVAVDGAGDVFVADPGNNAVEEIVAVGGVVSSSSTVITIGSGFSQPVGVAVDGAGDVFVADALHSAIKEIVAVAGAVSSSSTVITIGSGFRYPYGVGVDSAGDVFVANHGSNGVEEIVAVGGAVSASSTVIAIGSGYLEPFGVVVDGAGNIFVADTYHNVVKEIDVADPPSLSFASTAAGSTSSDSPQTVTVANDGNAPLTFEVPITGLNPSISTGFTYGGSSTCLQLSASSTAATLASGASCTELVSFTPLTNGSYSGSLVATDDTLNAAGPAYATQTVTLSGTAAPLVASQLTLAGVAATLAAGGNLGTVTVSVESSGGTVIPTSSASITVTITGPGGYSRTVTGTAVSGVASFNLSSLPLTVAGTYTVTTSSTPLTPAISTVTVTAGAASQLANSGVPATVAVGGNLGMLGVTIEDAYGNVVTTSSAAVTVTITGPGGYSQTLTGTAASGAASLNLSSLPLTAPGTYTATTSSAGLTSAISTFTVAAATSSLLTVAPNPVVAGQSATFTLTISPAPTGSPLGTASFYNGGTLLGTATVNGSGVATLSTTTLPVGSDSITAAYSGNSGFASSTSAAITLQVNPANATATVTAVTSSNLAPAYGQSVTLTATVTPAPTAVPPGSINFYAGTTLLGAQVLNAQGIATLSLSLPLGPNAITAVYSGSAGFAASTSSALSVSARALSAITFAASPTTQLATMPVVFTAQVNSATAGGPTGTISFLNGSTVLATVTIVPGQPAVYSETGLASGVYSVTASYSGDGSFLPSASTGAPISITVSTLDLALGGDNNQTVVPGAAVTYNFPLSPVLTPTFLYNVTLTATGLPPGATYSFSPASLPAGSGTVPVAFTVQTVKTTGMLRSSRGPWFALVFGLLVPLAGAKRFRARITTLPRVLMLLLFGSLSLGLVAGLGGCGSGGFLGTPPGQTNYTITIVATSGTLVRTTTVQLNLE